MSTAPVSTSQWDDTRRAFAQSAHWFLQLVETGIGRWNEAGLGDWTVRDLVGHTSRALLTVENYLDAQVTNVTIDSPAEYFRAMFAAAGDPVAVAQRGRDAGAALGPDIVDAISQITARVLTRVNAEQPDAAVATPAGGMRLIDYLPTRTFELVVHTCDLAAALGRPADVPTEAALTSICVLGALATQGGEVSTLLLAATGRRNLPPGFTVL